MTTRLTKEMRRVQIVETGLTIAANESLIAATPERIAEQIRMSKTGVLYHFPTRRALWSAMVAKPDIPPKIITEARSLGIVS